MAVYVYYIWTIRPTLWIIFFVAHVISAFTKNFSQVWLNWWTAARGTQLPLYLSVYVTFGVVSTVFILIFIWVVFLRIMPELAVQLHRKLLNAVIAKFSTIKQTLKISSRTRLLPTGSLLFPSSKPKQVRLEPDEESAIGLILEESSNLYLIFYPHLYRSGLAVFKQSLYPTVN